MSIHITKGGNQIRATGKDANALLAAVAPTEVKPRPVKTMGLNGLYKSSAALNQAIDAILELEGLGIFPNGLPDDFERVLARVRTERNDVLAELNLRSNLP